jgi:hypothetical protein
MNRKIDTARVFERIFEIYRDQFTLLIPAALVVFVPVAIISGLIYAGGVSLIGALIVAAAATIATYWFQGMVVEAARDILDGRRDHTVGSLVSSVTAVLGPLVVAGILAGIGITIGLVLVIVPGLFLLTIWAVIAPVIVIERARAMESFGRSRELVRGNGWNVFGTIVLGILISIGASIVVSILLVWLPDWLQSFLGSLVSNGVIAPFVAAAWTLMYFRLRGEPAAEVAPEPSPATPM